MGLMFTGEKTSVSGDTWLRAVDTESQRPVVVIVSLEAEGDLGLERALIAAETKYDKGELEPDGRLIVRSTDVLRLTPRE